MYLPLFVQGLTTTFKHLPSRSPEGVTVSYPEEEPEIGNPLIYRGVHRLNKDEQGRVKCVACFLCATACPAHCIDIIGVESPWPDREKYPQSFSIDELRCIYCGMCEEACPVDAIELTSLFDLTGRSREEMIFDKEKLLSVYDMTKDAEPMKSRKAWEAADMTCRQTLIAMPIADAGTWCALGGDRPARAWMLLPRGGDSAGCCLRVLPDLLAARAGRAVLGTSARLVRGMFAVASAFCLSPG